MTSARDITAHLGGDWHRAAGYGLCPGPDHSKRDRSMKVWDSPEGVLVHSFSPKHDWRECKEWLVHRGLIEPHTVSVAGGRVRNTYTEGSIDPSV